MFFFGFGLSLGTNLAVRISLFKTTVVCGDQELLEKGSSVSNIIILKRA
jgi:hypothetical protein